MTGFGRTGKWFAMDHWDVVPDIMTMAKGMTCGYLPLGATVVRKHIGDHFKENFFSHGATYAGHALGCATAMSLIPIYEEDNLIENSATLGAYFLEELTKLRSNKVKDVRGRGLMLALEFHPDTGGARRYSEALRQAGMLCKETHEDTLRISPPLVITRDQADWALEQVDKVLREA